MKINTADLLNIIDECIHLTNNSLRLQEASSPAEAGENFNTGELFGIQDPSFDPTAIRRINPRNVEIDITGGDIEYGRIQADRGALRAVNHHILRSSIKTCYYDVDKEGKPLPAPLLIWGAPGLGKSASVKSTAREIAAEKAKEKGLDFVNLSKLRDPIAIRDVLTRKDPKSYYFVEWDSMDESTKELLIHGPRVHGKHQTAETPTIDNVFFFFDIRVAGIEASDVGGMPTITTRTSIGSGGEETTEPSIHMSKIPFIEFIARNSTMEGIIMWDELNQGDARIQTMMYKIVLDRVIGNTPMPAGVGSFAAANSEMWGGDQIKNALSNRFRQCYLWVSADEWVDAFRDELNPMLSTFVTERPLVAYFVNEKGWNDYYSKRMNGTDMESYIMNPSKGKIPSARTLLEFNGMLNNIIDRYNRKTGSNDPAASEGLYEAIIGAAKTSVNTIWGDEFKKFLLTYMSIDWRGLSTDPKKNLPGVLNTPDSKEGLVVSLSEAIYRCANLYANTPDKNKPAFFTSLSPTNQKYLRIFINLLDTTHDDLAVLIFNKAYKRMAQTYGNATKNTDVEAADKLKVGRFFMAYLTSSLFTADESRKYQTAFAKSARIELSAAAGATPKESVSVFNKIYDNLLVETEEALNSIKSNDVAIERQNAMKKQQEGVTSIIKAISARMEQPGADLAAVIDECVSADTTLDTQQKQVLQQVISLSDSTTNSLVILKGYLTGKNFKLA